MRFLEWDSQILAQTLARLKNMLVLVSASFFFGLLSKLGTQFCCYSLSPSWDKKGDEHFGWKESTGTTCTSFWQQATAN
jgi:hypothetical protein